jgi:hypothetical protein
LIIDSNCEKTYLPEYINFEVISGKIAKTAKLQIFNSSPKIKES